MRLPRPSTLKHFLGISNASTIASSKKPSLPPKAAAPSTTPQINSAPKPYLVTRTGTKGVPVYLLSKRGGNLKQTKLRRIEGDINVLRTDLQIALGVEEKEVTINQLTKHIIIKVFTVSGRCSMTLTHPQGHKKSEVVKFLEENKCVEERRDG
jgi:large subunit ribosomal protein L49